MISGPLRCRSFDFRTLARCRVTDVLVPLPRPVGFLLPDDYLGLAVQTCNVGGRARPVRPRVRGVGAGSPDECASDRMDSLAFLADFGRLASRNGELTVAAVLAALAGILYWKGRSVLGSRD